MKTTNMLITTAMTLGLTAGAFAGDQKAGTPATPPAKEKAAMPADSKMAPPAAKKMEMPKPPQELADMAKNMTGSWKCTGKGAMDPSDMTKMADMKMTANFKLDMDKWWIRGDMTSKMGPMAMKMMMFTTYDANAKKWTRISVDNMGGSEVATSMGMKDNKMVWDGEMRGMMSGKTRTTEDMSTPKQVTLKGEMTTDGKTWVTGWEAVCKK